MDRQTLISGYPASDMIGLPIYSLETGRCIGSVKDVIFDSQHGKLLGFTLEDRGIFSPHRYVLTFDNVKSIGRDAITVESGRVLVKDTDKPEIRDVLKQEKTFGGKAIITRSGNDLGNLTDVLIDTNTGNAISYEVSRGVARDIRKGRGYVAAPQASLVGMDAVIVPDDTETFIEEQEPGGLEATYGTAYERGREKVAGYGAQEKAGGLWDQTRTGLQHAMENFQDATQEYSDRAGRKRAVAAQKQFLRGRISAVDVRDEDGNLILRECEVITPLVLDTLDRQGKLEQVKIRPEEYAEPSAVHLVVEKPKEHKQHRMKTHI